VDRNMYGAKIKFYVLIENYLSKRRVVKIYRI